MNVDLPAILQGGGTVTWLQLQGLFPRDSLADFAAFWAARNASNIVDASTFNVADVRDYFLNRRLPV